MCRLLSPAATSDRSQHEGAHRKETVLPIHGNIVPVTFRVRGDPDRLERIADTLHQRRDACDLHWIDYRVRLVQYLIDWDQADEAR
jgi:hypothetical protein